MMTLGELQGISINPEVARVAYEHAEKRLTDALATKASHEQKAFALLAACVTVSLAAFGVAGIAMARTDHWESMGLPFFFAGGAYSAGAVLALLALNTRTYGSIGSDPSMWLTPGIIDGGEKALPAMLAYLTYFHHDRIVQSAQSNQLKAKLIWWCVMVGVASPVILAIWVALLG